MGKKSCVNSMNIVLFILLFIFNGCGDSSVGANSAKQIVEAYKLAVKAKSLNPIQKFIYWNNIPKEMQDLYKNSIEGQIKSNELISADYTSIEDGDVLTETQIKIVGKIITRIKAMTDLTTVEGKIKKGEPTHGPSMLVGFKKKNYYIIFKRDKAAEKVYKSMKTMMKQRSQK